MGAARTESEQPAIVTPEPNLTLFRETGQLIDGAGLAHLLLRIDVQDENKALHKAERALKTIGSKTNDSDAVRGPIREIRAKMMAFKSLENMIESDADRHPRHRRQALPVAVGLAGLAGFAASVLLRQQQALNRIDSQEERITRLTHEVSANTHNEEEAKVLYDALLGSAGQQTSDMMKSDVISAAGRVASGIAMRADQKINALYQLWRGQLVVGLVSDRTLHQAYKALTEKLARHGLAPVHPDASHLYRYPVYAAFKRTTSEILVLLDVEAQDKDNEEWSLYEHVPVPWVSGNRTELWASPDKTMLAMNRHKDAFIELNDEDLRRCKNEGGLTLCRNSHVQTKGPKAGCLPALFHRDAKAISKNCLRRPVPLQYTRRVNDTTFVHYSQSQHSATVACSNETQALSLTGVSLIQIRPGCTLSTDTLVFNGPIPAPMLPTVTLEMPRPEEALWQDSQLRVAALEKRALKWQAQWANTTAQLRDLRQRQQSRATLTTPRQESSWEPWLATLAILCTLAIMATAVATCWWARRCLLQGRALQQLTKRVHYQAAQQGCLWNDLRVQQQRQRVEDRRQLDLLTSVQRRLRRPLADPSQVAPRCSTPRETGDWPELSGVEFLPPTPTTMTEWPEAAPEPESPRTPAAAPRPGPPPAKKKDLRRTPDYRRRAAIDLQQPRLLDEGEGDQEMELPCRSPDSPRRHRERSPLTRSRDRSERTSDAPSTRRSRSCNPSLDSLNVEGPTSTEETETSGEPRGNLARAVESENQRFMRGVISELGKHLSPKK